MAAVNNNAALILSTLPPGIQSQPTLFELFAIDQLQSLLPTALSYSWSLLTLRFPRLFLILRPRFLRNRQRLQELLDNSVYYGLQVLVEYYYLKRWHASFCEHFYGLKRTPISMHLKPRQALKEGSLKEPLKSIWKPIFVLVGFYFLSILQSQCAVAYFER
jgi:hypothetical protein